MPSSPEAPARTPIPPRTMKAARLYGPGDIRIEEEAVPRPGPGEALMRTRASGICSGDVMPWYVARKAPLILGHEPAGEIVALGAGAAGVAPGDRVFVHHHAPCMRCPRCATGNYVQCPVWRKAAISPGGIAEYVLIGENALIHDTLVLPEGVSLEDGALVEPLGCVVKGLKRASGGTLPMAPGWFASRTALVIGLGVMGMLHVLALARLGTGRIIGADMVPYRLGRALQLGATHVINVSGAPLAEGVSGLTDGGMADLVVVGPNSVGALRDGLGAAAPGGVVLMFTPVVPGETLTLDPNELYFKDISLITTYSAGPDDTREALAWIAGGGVSARDVVTHRFPIERTAEAYSLTAQARDSLKCLIVFP